MEKITINKVEDMIIQNPVAPITNRYEVLIEETRKDEAGNDYAYTRKEYTTVKDIDRQIESLTSQINTLKNRKALITKIA